MSRTIRKSEEVEVDIDEFDTDDIVEELCSRIIRDKVTQKELKEIFDAVNRKNFPSLRSKSTLEDLIKYEHMMRVWNKYTSVDFERLLP